MVSTVALGVAIQAAVRCRASLSWPDARAHWWGARMVNLMPSAAIISSDVAVDGGLGQPHALGLAAEAVLEVGDAPADLRERVAPAGQRHDDVVVDLRHGRAVAAVALAAAAFAVQNHAIGARRVLRSQLSSVGPKLKLMRA